MAINPLIARGYQGGVTNAFYESQDNAAQTNRRNALLDAQTRRINQETDEDAQFEAAQQAKDWPTMFRIDPDAAQVLYAFDQQQKMAGLGDIPVREKIDMKPLQAQENWARDFTADQQYRKQQLGLQYAQESRLQQQANAPAPGPKPAEVARIRKEFRSLQPVKDYETALPLLVSARNAPDNGYGDLQLIYTAGKVLDPGSVVREGELALTIAAGSPLQRVIGQTRFSTEKGGRLTAETRKQLLDMLNERVLAYRQGYDREYQQYAEYGQASGMAPRDVVGRHAANAYAKPGAAAPQQNTAARERANSYYKKAP